MLQFIRDIPLRYKLITCFMLIIGINAVSGLMNLNSVKQISELVNITYDKALMSGTFAQAAKFNFSEFDSAIKSSLVAENLEDFDLQVEKSNTSREELLEDLKVVEVRSLSGKSSELIQETRVKLKDLNEETLNILARKRTFLTDNLATSGSMILSKDWDKSKTKRNLYRRLTALYDEAAEVGYNFRLTSEEKNKKTINSTLVILISCIVVSLILSISIAFILIRPLFKLQKVCQQVEQGNFGSRAKVLSKDELGTFSSSLNFMLDTIQDKNESMTSLLSSLPFGLFYFDENGTISKERSIATDSIFKDFNHYQTLNDFYSAHNVKTKQIPSILRAIFLEVIPFDSAVFLFPDIVFTNLDGETKTIHLSFKPKYGANQNLETVIMLAEDITEKNKALAESKELTERVERVSKASADIDSFKEFFPAVKKLYEATIEYYQKLDLSLETEHKRNLHSLKGLLGVYSFNSCAEEIHNLEEQILSNALVADCLKTLTDSKTHFETQLEDIINLLTLNKDSNLKYFDINKVNNVKKLASLVGNPELTNALINLDKFPASKVLAKYKNYAQVIVEKFEDKKIELHFTNSDELSYADAQRIDFALVHILNNSIDHGIEPVDVRVSLQKNEVGQIQIGCKRNSDQGIEVLISDDGKGINGDQLLSKAVDVGLISSDEAGNLTNEQKISLIFASGLSTKDVATEVSGRGIGMDAVRSYLESIGGKIELTSTLGIGTTFKITIPPEDKNEQWV